MIKNKEILIDLLEMMVNDYDNFKIQLSFLKNIPLKEEFENVTREDPWLSLGMEIKKRHSNWVFILSELMRISNERKI